MGTAVSDFNNLPAELAVKQLLSCCASTAWARRVAAGRPYSDRDAVLEVAERAFSGLTWAEVGQALDAHPRIGERAAGPSPEAAWSRREQSGVGTAGDDVRAELAAVNRDYEERFGYLFLIHASGRSAEEMLAEARRRLRNDPRAEQAEVRRELGRIALNRLASLLS
ncbi:MAG: 2-oxo-4-hydroxy-4-carboxy-5-ureidoimidazoline decarboxylase [Hamadaea sp.]|nr:2-oxo-4-hydroxy-4-carboxy-5-ureidoimidazoline decarboxylase [Hamadaea sp.]